jgi:hypothetical protein
MDASQGQCNLLLMLQKEMEGRYCRGCLELSGGMGPMFLFTGPCNACYMHGSNATGKWMG